VEATASATPVDLVVGGVDDLGLDLVLAPDRFSFIGWSGIDSTRTEAPLRVSSPLTSASFDFTECSLSFIDSPAAAVGMGSPPPPYGSDGSSGIAAIWALVMELLVPLPVNPPSVAVRRIMPGNPAEPVETATVARRPRVCPIVFPGGVDPDPLAVPAAAAARLRAIALAACSLALPRCRRRRPSPRIPPALHDF